MFPENLNTSKVCLYLIPNFIGEERWEWAFPEINRTIVNSLSYFIAEDAKACRYLLKQAGYPDISKANIVEYNEHSDDSSVEHLTKPLLEGHSMGLVSEAGCPVIADPGDSIVRWAHRHSVNVVPLIGVSSIMLAIMSAGLSGNNFAFNGYLPIENHHRIRKIKELEQFSYSKKQAQFFIEAPYRNQKLLSLLIQVLHPDTWLSLACALYTKESFISTKRISEWKKSSLPNIQKKPCIFGIMKE
ncbi:MAG: SAM-dependent methyltransferase [Bacteroidia bacterium]|nr:SAM-dependent methyltransferase [Bacteroidia bacterium]